MHRLTEWLNYLVKMLARGALLLACKGGYCQNAMKLSLPEVYKLSEQNYPLIKQKNLVEQTESLTVKNLGSGFLPQLAINGQATYQSDVTRVDIPLPNIKIPSQSKDQYRAVAELNQQIYDGGVIREQQNIQQLSSSVEQTRVDVDLYNLKNRITQIYFSILYQDELMKQNMLLMKDIQAGIDKVQQQVNNGVVLRSNLQVLQVQLLQAGQRSIELNNTRKGLADALALFIGKPVEELEAPAAMQAGTTRDSSLLRPELKLYAEQSLLLEGQQRLVDKRNHPKLSAFVQGGYGKPALNLLSDKFELFYVTGLRLNWSLGGFYNARRDRSLLDINRQSVELQKETFQLNTQSQLKQQYAEIERFRQLVASDEAIIALRGEITKAAKAQLENAVITANDYLREVNAEDLARQAIATHQLQLLQAQVNYQLTTGRL